MVPVLDEARDLYIWVCSTIIEFQVLAIALAFASHCTGLAIVSFTQIFVVLMQKSAGMIRDSDVCK